MAERRRGAREANPLTQLNQTQVDFLFLADRAEAINGKLYVMGGAWDRLMVTDFNQPVSLSMALSVLVPWGSTNEEHQLTIRIVTEDGVEVASLGAQINVGRPPNAVKGQPFRALLAVNGGFKLPGPGTYVVSAAVAGGESRSTLFHAVPAERALQYPPIP